MTIRQYALALLRDLRDHRNYVLIGVLISAFVLVFANFWIGNQALARLALGLGVATMLLGVVFDFLFDPVVFQRRDRKAENQ